MSSDKVEQAVRAIRDLPWPVAIPDHVLEVVARTVIETMRNPTDEMVNACQRALVETIRDLGWSKAQRAGRLTSQTKAVMRWNAMVDCALK